MFFYSLTNFYRLPVLSCKRMVASKMNIAPFVPSLYNRSHDQHNIPLRLYHTERTTSQDFYTSINIIHTSNFKKHNFLSTALKRSLSSKPPSEDELEAIKKLARGTRKGTKPKEFILSWRNVFITLGFGGGCLLFMLYLRREKDLAREKERVKSLGKASLGGPWELVDHTGKLRKSSDFRGKWILIYFGFTHCPDVCPDEIEKIVKVVDKLEKDKQVGEVIPLFITVDPHRDDIKAVAEYIKEFSPKIIGFSGSDEQIKKATRAYRVYYSEGPKDVDEDYIVDHTIISYLVNPEEEFTDFYGQNKGEEEMINSIKMHMVKYESNAKKG